jgi:hypothetical protein
LFGDGWHADLEAAMKTVLLGLRGAVFCGVVVGIVNPVKLGAEHLRFEQSRTSSPIIEASVSQLKKAEEVHSAVVDIPRVADLSHASPDTWHTLPPPVQVYEQLPATVTEPNEVQLLTSLRQPTFLAGLSSRNSRCGIKQHALDRAAPLS